MTTENKQPNIPPGTGHTHQTFLVGEEVYLRTFQPGDEKNANSWQNSIFPVSPEWIEKWIKEALPGEGRKQRAHLAIIRKRDDVIVGSLTDQVSMPATTYRGSVDPLYGAEGDRWLAEAIAIAAEWRVHEHFVPVMTVELTSDRSGAIEALLERGFVETSRLRETLEKNNQRFDTVRLSRFSDSWLKRLGNPLESEIPRVGNGEVVPVSRSRQGEGDPPKQAVIIGERVYLRPQDKSDAKRDIDMARLDEETAFEIGRRLTSKAAWAASIGAPGDGDYPHSPWFTVCLRETDEQIGAVGLMGVDWVNRTGETGSTFYKDYRGKGYGTEAKHLLLEYAFDTLGLHCVNSLVYFSNTRSAAALRKQGYREAGRLCWTHAFAGGFGNEIVFDLLASEWRALPRAQS